MRNRTAKIIAECLEPRQFFAVAVPGTVDTTFGQGGLATSDTPTFGSASSMVVQPDGKIVLGVYGGDIVRYMPDGQLDTSFGNKGVIDRSAVKSFGTTVALQANGDIVVADTDITDNNAFQVQRYNPDGSLDTSFGSNGVRLIEPSVTLASYSSAVQAIAINPAGEIFVAGYVQYTSGTTGYTNFAMASLDSSGTPSDLHLYSFPVLDFAGAHTSQLTSMTLDGDRIILGGLIGIHSSTYEAGLMAVNLDGSIDTSFGSNGFVVSQLGYDDELYALGVQSNGDIIVVGLSNSTPPYQSSSGNMGVRLSVVRYIPNGKIDTTFGTNGSVLSLDPLGPGPNLDNSGTTGFAVAVAADDSLYIGGQAQTQMMAVHYSVDGQLLASNGNPNNPGFPEITTSAMSVAGAIALQNGKVLLAGAWGTYSASAFQPGVLEMMRLNSDLTLDQAFATDQKQWVSGEPGGVVVGDAGGVALNSSGASITSAMQPDGKVVTLIPAGAGSVPIFSLPVTLIRFNNDGSRDLTFTPSAGINGTAIAALSNGKLIVAGNPATGVIRLNADGTLDSMFITNHAITSAVGSILPLTNGDLLIAAGASVYRLLPNGAPDTTFGSAGVATGVARNITSLAIIPDGSIITAGSEVVEKFTAGGKVDASFNGTGTLTVPAADVATDGSVTEIPITTNTTLAQQNVVVQPSGDILVTATVQEFVYTGHIAGQEMYAPGQLIRLTPNGAVDPTFGSSGSVLIPAQSARLPSINSIMLETDGKLLVAGSNYAFVNRYDANGQTDSSFTPNIAAISNYVQSSVNTVFESPTGQIVLSGTASNAYGVTNFISALNVVALTQINSGVTVTPVAPTGITPSIVTSKIPSTAVSGMKSSGTVSMTLNNTTASPIRGVYSIALYASTDAAIDSISIPLAVIKRKLVLKAGRSEGLRLSVRLKTLPAGSYTILGQTTDAAGNVITTPTGPAVAVSAPVISLTPTINAISLPAVNAPGARTAKYSIAATITNHGNIPATGISTITVFASTDGSASDGTVLISRRMRLGLRPGKSTKLRFSLSSFSALAAGNYFLVVQITDPTGTSQSVTSSGSYAMVG